MYLRHYVAEYFLKAAAHKDISLALALFELERLMPRHRLLCLNKGVLSLLSAEGNSYAQNSSFALTDSIY